MRLLDVLERRKNEECVEHDINPVYDTAKSCLANLVRAQCEEAIRLNSVLRFTENTKAGNMILKGTALFQEIRYRFVNYEIEKTGIRNILDIGCGYSPRGIMFSECGYNYVGADLPAVIRKLEPAVIKCAGSDPASRIRYIGLDATDSQALIRAAESFDGSVCIITEGLMMYLPTYELDEFLKGIRAILKVYGGCMITPDFCMNRLLKLSTSAASNKIIGEALQIGATKVVKDYYVSAGNEMDPSVWYSTENDKKPYDYFSEKGFHIERIKIFHQGMKLNALQHIKESHRNKLIEEYKKTYGWKITV